MQIISILPGVLAILSAIVNLAIVHREYTKNRWKILIYIQIGLLFIAIWASLILSQHFINNHTLNYLAGHIAIIYLFGMMFAVHRANYLIFFNSANTKLLIYDILFTIILGFTVTLSFHQSSILIAMKEVGSTTTLSPFFGSMAIFVSLLAGASIFILILRVAHLAEAYNIQNSKTRLYVPFLLVAALFLLLGSWQYSTKWRTPQLHVFLYFSVLVSFVLGYTYGIKPVSYVFYPYELQHILLIKPQGLIAYSKSFVTEPESMVHLFSSGLSILNIYLNSNFVTGYPSQIQVINFKERQILVREYASFSLVFITQRISFQLQALFELVYRQIFLQIDLLAISKAIIYDSETSSIIDDVIHKYLGGF